MFDKLLAKEIPDSKKRRLPRWSLKGMIWLLAIIALVCGVWTAIFQKSREDSYVSKLRSQGFEVYVYNLSYRERRDRNDPAWHYVTGVHLDINKFRGELSKGRAKLIGSNHLGMIRYLDEIESLSLDQSDVDSEALLSLACLPALRELSVANTDIDDRLLRAVGKYQKLEALDFQGTLVTENGLQELADCDQLHTLIMNDACATDEALVVVGKHPNINHLEACADRESPPNWYHKGFGGHLLIDSDQISDRGLGAIDSTARFSSLYLRSPKITGSFLRGWGSLEDLEYVDVTGCPNFDPLNVAYLTGISMRTLNITCKPSELRGVAFKKSPITVVNILWDAPLDEDDHKAIAEMKAKENTMYIKDGIRKVAIHSTK